MRHLRPISKANQGGTEDLTTLEGLLDRVFGFVLDLVDRKGKGD